MITNLARGVRTFTSNAFLVTGERTVLVDTGSNFPVVERVRAARDERADGSGDGAALDAVVLTHTHPDHVGNLAAVREAFDVETWGFDPEHEAVDNAVADGDELRLGDHVYTAYHTPGHKDDHLCLHSREGVLFSGDLVFGNGSFGRTDLPEGDRPALVRSIERIESVVGEELRELHPGHGRSITDDPYLDVQLAGQAASTY